MIALNDLNTGDKVLAKVGKNGVLAEVLEKTDEHVLVKSLNTGRVFTARNIMGLIESTGPQESSGNESTPFDESPAPAEPEETPDCGEQETPSADTPEEVPPSDTSEATDEGNDSDSPEIPRSETTGDAAGEEPVKQEGTGKKMSLLNAAAEILKQADRPMNTRELVRQAIDCGLWKPTGCRTPEQSLYGAIFSEIKKTANPRFKKSPVRGKFERA